MNLIDFIEITKGRLIKRPEVFKYNISIDTRTINEDDIFIPICFKDGNGNDYISKASNIASLVLIPSDYLNNTNIYEEITNNNKDIGIIEIDNGLQVLKRLASYKMSQYQGKVIAITGSNGKTSTKELLHLILNKKYNTFKSKDNFNNILGLCLMILDLQDEDYAIFELGMNHMNEISEMSILLKPDIALITNIGTAHIGNLNSKENILKAKLEIVEGFKEKSILFINNEDELLTNINYINLVKYNYLNSVINSTGLEIEINNKKIKLKLFGKQNIYNISAAYAIARYLQVDDELIISALKEYEDIRMKRLFVNDTLIIDDTYNANYESMINGVDYVNMTNYKYKILVLADMLELGSDQVEIHKNVGKYIKDTSINKVYTYGDISRYIGNTCNKISFHYDDLDKLANDLKKEMGNNTIIYLKGSHGMHLAKIVNKLF